jgi:hypothetical protein
MGRENDRIDNRIACLRTKVRISRERLQYPNHLLELIDETS